MICFEFIQTTGAFIRCDGNEKSVVIDERCVAHARIRLVKVKLERIEEATKNTAHIELLLKQFRIVRKGAMRARAPLSLLYRISNDCLSANDLAITFDIDF